MAEAILVRVPQCEREHVIWDKLDPVDGRAWWEMGRLPRLEEVQVFFLCGGEILGEAKAEVDREEGRLVWDRQSAVRYSVPVSYRSPQKQGWRYFTEASGSMRHDLELAATLASRRDARQQEKEALDAMVFDEIFGG